MKKPRETMTFDLAVDLLARLEAISRKTKIPVDVLIVWAHVQLFKKYGIEKPGE